MHFVRRLFSFLALLLFVPLFLALLFLMPVEFGTASWHLWRASAVTSGTVLTVEQDMNRGNSRSLVTYCFQVNGREIIGSRTRAGWISDRGYEAGAGEFTVNLKPGSVIPVHYDPRWPEFSLLEYGWPKWSIGFSMAVWGLLLGSHVFPSQARHPSSHLAYGLTRSCTLTGFLTIALLDPTICPSVVAPILAVFLVMAVVAGIYSRIRFQQAQPSSISNASA